MLNLSLIQNFATHLSNLYFYWWVLLSRTNVQKTYGSKWINSIYCWNPNLVRLLKLWITSINETDLLRLQPALSILSPSVFCKQTTVNLFCFWSLGSCLCNHFEDTTGTGLGMATEKHSSEFGKTRRCNCEIWEYSLNHWSSVFTCLEAVRNVKPLTS